MVGFKCIGQGCKMRRWRLNKGNGGTVQGLSLKRVQMLSSKKGSNAKLENFRCGGQIEKQGEGREL